MPEITIAGKTFTIEPRFAEGHTLTALEAGALNQTFFENVRNNLASAVKKGELEDQAGVDSYAKSYEFGARRSGSGRAPIDPLEAESLRVATEAVKAAIRKAGHTNVSAETIKAKALQALDHEVHGPKLRATAKKRLADLAKLTGDETGLDIDGVESGPKRTRKAAEATVEQPAA